ncbi:MAG: peptide deformylase [Theionarchaea archaeon]|nr:peptide deformylase [Theionarchaea archaeon]
MTLQDILLLGNPLLYEPSSHINQGELGHTAQVVHDLHDTLMDFRNRHGTGRAIAAPQIGIHKRLIYMHITHPLAMINPVLTLKGDQTMEVWDDCMSFPDLLVKVPRHACCEVVYRDLSWELHEWDVRGDLSELIQHEYDHLDGILAVSRAIDEKSFCLKSQRHLLEEKE